MRLRINLHLRVDGARLYLSLDPSSYPSTDHVQSFAAQRARSWLANDNVAVFAAGLDKRCHVVVMPPVDERGEEECVCHVYCVETKHTGVGMSVREVATQMESVFQLTDVREEGIIPWITCQDGEGCSYCDRAFEDCPTTAETLYEPGSVFLVQNDDRSISTSCSCSTVPLSPPAGNDNDMKFREAFRETESPHASANDHSLVGVPFSSRPRAPSSPSKADQTRRDPITTQQAPSTPDIISPPLRVHKNLVGGGSQRPGTPGTPRKTGGRDNNSDVSELESGQQVSTVVNVPLRLEAEGGARDACEGSQRGAGEGGEAGEGVGGDGGGEGVGSAVKVVRLSTSGRDQLTNGLNLPAVTITPSDLGESIVPGVNYKLSDILRDGARTLSATSTNDSFQHDERIKRVFSSPELTSIKPKYHRGTLRNAMSCENVQVRADNHSQCEGEMRMKGRGVVIKVGWREEEREGDGEGERMREGVQGDGIVNTLAVPSTSPRMSNSQETSGESKLQKGHSTESMYQESTEELQRMHALEHACNGTEGACHLNDQDLDLCCQQYDEGMVDDMCQRLEAYERGGALDREMRSLIVLHCRYCQGSGCKVPHLAAGCPPAGIMYTPSPSYYRFSKKSPSNSTHCTSPPLCSHPHSSQPPSSQPPCSTHPQQPSPSPHTSQPHSSPLASPPPSSPPHTSPSPCTPTQPPPYTSPHTSQFQRGIATVDFDLYPANTSLTPSPPSPSQPPPSLSSPPSPSLTPFPPSPSLRGIAPVSFDVEPANVSESPTHKPFSPTHTRTAGHPTTLHTISDSPHHRVTHVPLVPPQRPKTDLDSEMIVPPMYMPQNQKMQLENTFLQGTFSPKRPSNVVPIDRPALSVAQATEDVPAVPEKPHPPPIASSKASNRQPNILNGIIPGKFPTAKQLDSNKVIFSTMSDVIVGSELPMTDIEKSQQLGKGGNGRIFRYPLLNESYAVKHTAYRPGELSEWRRFDHPNVIQLLMVCSLVNPTRCCQFMPLMDCNLSAEVRNTCSRGVVWLYSQLQGQVQRAEVMCNAQHIMRGVIEGTAYLHDDMHIQHFDLKASNILVKKRCSCADIFTCACPESDKCLLKLADFDSVKPFQPRVLARHCQEWKPYVPMSEEECGKVMGTPGYRAPEQFMKLAPVVSPDHTLFGRSLEGSWTDIWNVGHICLTIFLGPNTAEEKQEAWTMNGWPYFETFSRTYVRPELTHSILKLLKLSLSTPRDAFTAVCKFTHACFQPDYRRRPTARHLLDHELLTNHYSVCHNPCVHGHL